LLYRAERTKLDARQLSRRLNATDLEAPLPIVDAEPVPLPAARVESSPSETTTPPSIDTDDDSPGDLFGNLLDEMPREELNDTGTTIPVRDMALPKHFSGKTPKVNLEETVRKVDKYATISFKVISRSRAVRASVSIRWDGGRNQTFEMQETACWDQPQAYNYIATVALFKISHTAVNKQLPLLFRDLWDELVVKQKEEDDEAYRHQLKLFRAIAEPRLQPPPSRVRPCHRSCRVIAHRRLQDSKVAKIQEAPAGVHATPSSATEVSVQESEKLMQELYVRQQWPSYQEMLVSSDSLCDEFRSPTRCSAHVLPCLSPHIARLS
jgi:ATP-dependent RNA helicase DHX29